jgi:hypothetical protein
VISGPPAASEGLRTRLPADQSGYGETIVPGRRRHHVTRHAHPARAVPLVLLAVLALTKSARAATQVRFPTPSSTGVPAHWHFAHTRSQDLVVNRPGAVVQSTLFKNGDLIVNAPNVTVNHVDMQGGRIINDSGSRCANGLLVENSTFEPPPGHRFAQDSEGATGEGGYTARRVKIWRREEGFRDGGKSGGCGPVHIEDSFAKISIPPGCPGNPHSDGLQGYDGPPLTVSDVTIDFREADCGTAPFFVPNDQGNTTATIDNLLVAGGGASFRDGVRGSVRGLRIVNRSWFYFPVDVNCSLLSAWDASRVLINSRYEITRTVGRQRCT